MKDVNEIVICKEDYETTEDWENAIKKAIMVLLDNNYIMTIGYDEKDLGIVVVEYNYDNECYGGHYPYWLSPDEWESVVWDNEREEES